MSSGAGVTSSDGVSRGPRFGWRVYALVFAASAVGFLLTYQMLNDHFNRLARAREIAAFREVPFRDFLDPGYFLGLYASALMQRITGHLLLADLILDVTCLAIGATVVFAMTTDFTRSVRWGVAAAALVVLGQPRSYDFDKVLFLTLCAWMCWQYARTPTALRLVGLSALGVVAGLFRYDNAVYVGTAALATLVSRHWGEWRTLSRRLALAGIAAVVLLLPALLFVARTAGLVSAIDQIASYTGSGAERTSLFHPTRVIIDESAPVVSIGSPFWRSQLLPGYLTRPNAAAWVYVVAMALPWLVIVDLVLRRREVTRAYASAMLGMAALLQMLALFVLREPIEAHAGAVLPIVLAVCAGLLGQRRGSMLKGLVGFIVAVAGLVSLVALVVMFDRPPVRNLNVFQRVAQFAEEPPALDLMPDSRYAPLVQYLRQCTQPQDRLLVGWFAPEMFVFAERGFAGRRGLVFAEYWSQDRYEQLTIDELGRQSVPVILMPKDQEMASHPLIWRYVVNEYQRVDGAERDDMPLVDVWARRDRPVTSWFGKTPLPCYGKAL